MKDPKRTPTAERDQDPTVFTAVLEKLLDRAPGAAAAALVDGEGETVDYAGALPVFFTKVAAAHFRIVFGEVDESLRDRLGSSMQLVVRAAERTFLVRALHDGYALVLLLKRRAFAISSRAMVLAVRDLSREAGWPAPAIAQPFWHPVEVEEVDRVRRRPARMLVGARWQKVEVLGGLVGLRHERGYRCRLHAGAELTLVREAGGAWYAEELVSDDSGAPKLSLRSFRPPVG